MDCKQQFLKQNFPHVILFCPMTLNPFNSFFFQILLFYLFMTYFSLLGNGDVMIAIPLLMEHRQQMVCKNQAKNTFLVLLMDRVVEKGTIVVKSVESSQNLMGEKCRCV